MQQKTIVITGASDGIGAAAARRLALEGHRVVVVGRSAEKTEKVAADIGAPFHLADYAELSQVRRLAAELRDAYPRIDVLVNNAGAVMNKRTLTVDGHESTFQVNHLGPFLLTTLLVDRLAESRASVVTTASAAHRYARLDLDNLAFARGFSAMRAYGTAKLANILFTIELDRRYRDRGISAASVHPGVIKSSFGSQSNVFMRMIYSWPFNLLMETNEQGADTLAWLAGTEPGTDWEPGEYYAKRRPASRSAAAADLMLAERLWDRSAELVG